MGDWKNGHTGIPVLGRGCQNHGRGTLFDTFLLSAQILSAPAVAIANDQTGNRRLKWHGLRASASLHDRKPLRPPEGWLLPVRRVRIREIIKVQHLLIQPIEALILFGRDQLRAPPIYCG